MKTDRELLELAAKAAGIEYIRYESKNTKGLILEPLTDCEEGYPIFWNPLTDDGDALRLAVKLRLDICTEENDLHPTGNRQICHVNVWAADGGAGCSEDRDNEPYSATRRAIVRAATAIGEKMP